MSRQRPRKMAIARPAKIIVAPPARPLAHASDSHLPMGYPALLEDIKSRIRGAQIKAALSVNRELIALYWSIGRDIVLRQEAEGWGKSIVERLSADLRAEFPGVGGFSPANIWYMRSFYLAWANAGEFSAHGVPKMKPSNLQQAVGETSRKSILQQPVAELIAQPIAPPPMRQFLTQAASELKQPVSELTTAKLPQPVAEIPWGHNIILLEKLKDPAQRLWYARQTTAHGWSRSMLVHWIESDLYARQGAAINNFEATLPAAQSDLARQLIKDPYNFDFLTLSADAAERELEQGLLAHIRKFLLELGAGFAFVGQQVPLEVAGKIYTLDLLFYHLRLRCFIVIDLKTKAFRPEYAGKMNFYLSAVDDLFRHPGDRASIGLILCQTRKKTVAEYALRDLAKPIGVARYIARLVETLPEEYAGALPSVREIEAELAWPRRTPTLRKPAPRR